MMEEEFDEYEAISTYRQNGNLAIVRGSLRYEVNSYDGQVPQRPRTPMNRVDLVRRWLNGDTGFMLSQYRKWLHFAERFLNGITYSKVEHTDLLVRAFEVYIQRQN